MNELSNLEGLLERSEWAKDWPHNIVPPGAHELACEAIRALPSLIARLKAAEEALEPFDAAWREAKAAADIAPMIETARRELTAEDFRRARLTLLRARALKESGS